MVSLSAQGPTNFVALTRFKTLMEEDLLLSILQDDIIKDTEEVSALISLYAVKYLCKEEAEAEVIADAITRIASASESCTASMNTFIASGTSIGEAIAEPLHIEASGTSIDEVIDELLHIEVITSDSDWHTRCCQLMRFKPAREMFVALQGNELLLLHWLKHAAYNPLPFMKIQFDLCI